MRYAISVAPAGPAGDPRTMAELAAEAERAGWDAGATWWCEWVDPVDRQATYDAVRRGPLRAD